MLKPGEKIPYDDSEEDRKFMEEVSARARAPVPPDVEEQDEEVVKVETNGFSFDDIDDEEIERIARERSIF